MQVRDLGLLESAVARPRTSLIGDDAYPSVHEKAAVLLESLVRNHPLVDGNKRLGWMAVETFYYLNDIILDAPATDEFADAYDLVLAVASGQLDYRETVASLVLWTRPAHQQDR